MTAVLELSGVSKVYPGPPPVRALDGVDVSIAAGDLVAIIGPSGAGKSTLLHMMGALDRPTDGTIEIDGVDIATLSDRRLSGLRSHRIGFVFQDFFLIEGITATANVAEGLLYRGLGRTEMRSSNNRLSPALLSTRNRSGREGLRRPGSAPVRS